MLELQSKVSRLREVNTGDTSLSVVARLQEYLFDACTQGEHDFSVYQTRAGADWDMLHIAARDRSDVQLLPKGDGQKGQNV